MKGFIVYRVSCIVGLLFSEVVVTGVMNVTDVTNVTDVMDVMDVTIISSLASNKKSV